MKAQWRGKSLASLHFKRAAIGEINAKIFHLSQERARVEGEFLAELAMLLERPDAALLDSHHVCSESPVETCVYEVTLGTEAPGCLFCKKPISR